MNIQGKIHRISAIAALLVSAFILCLTCSTNAASDMTIAGATVSADAGSTVEYAVSVANNPGIAGYHVYVDYDKSVLTPVTDDGDLDITLGDGFTKGSTSTRIDDSGYFEVLWYYSKNVTTNGNLFTVKFQVAEGAASNTYPITIRVEADDNVNASYEVVQALTNNGSVIVGGGAEPAADAATIYGDSVSASAGTTVDYAVSIRNNPGIAGYHVYVDYDKDVLTPVTDDGDLDLALGSSFAKGSTSTRIDDSGYFEVLWYYSKNVTADGALFTVSFNVAEGAVSGTYPITIRLEADDNVNAAYEVVSVSSENGALTISSTTAERIENTITAENKTLTSSNADQTFVINASVNGGAELTYSSDNSSVVVDETGTVTVKAGYSGTTSITITSAATDVYQAAEKTITITVQDNSSVPDNGAVIKVDSVTGYVGKEVTVPVELTKNPGIAGFGFKVAYDTDVLTLEEIKAGDILSKGTFNTNGDIVTWYSTSDMTDTGAILYLVFQVSENAVEGDTEVTVSLNGGKLSNLSDEDSNNVPAEFELGTLNIAKGLVGDVNGDGEVAIADVVLLNRGVLGIVSLTDLQQMTGDVNGDGEVAIADVVKLNRYVLGVIDTLEKVKSSILLSGDVLDEETSEETPVIAADKVEVTADNEISVPVRISGNTGIAGLGLEISLDEGLTLESITRGDLLNCGTFTVNGNSMTWYDTKNVTGDGVLFTINVRAEKDYCGTEKAVEISLRENKKSNVSNEDSDMVAVSFASGSVNIQHSEVTDEAVTATCTENGLTEGSHCSVCSKVLKKQETVQATGHKAANAVKENEIAATYTVTGSYDEVVYCTVCHKELSRKSVVVPVLTPKQQTNEASGDSQAADAQQQTIRVSQTAVTFTYNASKIQQKAVTVSGAKGTISFKSSNKNVYLQGDKVCVAKNTAVGTYTITVSAAATASGDYKASNAVKITVNIVKAANPIVVSPQSKSFKASALKKKAATFTLKVNSAQGKVTYKSSSAKVKVTAKGKITIKKGTKKGTYKITVKAAGNGNYNATTKTVKVVVK